MTKILNRFSLAEFSAISLIMTGLLPLQGAQAAEVNMNKEEKALPSKATSTVLPRGVYWPGEYTFSDEATPEQKWEKIDRILEKLSKGGVNTVWLTHTSTTEAAKWSEHAAKFGIGLVAATDETSPDRTVPLVSEQEGIVEGAIEAWGSAPAPIAWGLCDEPELNFMDDLDHYTEVWRERGQPVTTVIIPTSVEAAGKQVKNLDYFCVDPYPFFSAYNPNGPNTHLASINYYLETCNKAAFWAEKNHSNLWVMAQLFQDPMGPWKTDESGNVVYLPGGGPHWRMPSPAEVSWQGWSAIAQGARGIFFYSLFLASPENATIQTPPENARFLVKEETNSGSPIAILYPNGDSTPQYEAMSAFYQEVQRHEGLILTMVRTKEPLASLGSETPTPGDLVRSFISPDGNKYLVVVNGNLTEHAEVPVNLDAKLAEGIVGVLNLRDNSSLKFSDKDRVTNRSIAPEKQFSVGLKPGEGALIQLVGDGTSSQADNE